MKKFLIPLLVSCTSSSNKDPSDVGINRPLDPSAQNVAPGRGINLGNALEAIVRFALENDMSYHYREFAPGFGIYNPTN